MRFPFRVDIRAVHRNCAAHDAFSSGDQNPVIII